mgnify:CR=1 FL=1
MIYILILAKVIETLGTKLNFSTAYHSQIDGQSDRTIQILKNMLRSCIVNFRRSWAQSMTLIEFAYNSSCHASIQMAPYEAIYRGKCHLPIHWNEIGERKAMDSATIHWLRKHTNW